MNGRSKSSAPLRSLCFLAGLALSVGCASASSPGTGTGSSLPEERRNLGGIDTNLAGLLVDPRAAVVGTAPTYLDVTVPVTNTTDSIVTVDYGACAVGVLLHRSLRPRGEPVWDSAHRTSPEGYIYACEGYAVVAKLLPGTTHRPHEFRSTIPIYEILGDSLPEGRYFVTALFRLNQRETRLEVGTVELSRDYGRLPAERTIEGVRYSVLTRIH